MASWAMLRLAEELKNYPYKSFYMKFYQKIVSQAGARKHKKRASRHAFAPRSSHAILGRRQHPCPVEPKSSA